MPSEETIAMVSAVVAVLAAVVSVWRAFSARASAKAATEANDRAQRVADEERQSDLVGACWTLQCVVRACIAAREWGGVVVTHNSRVRVDHDWEALRSICDHARADLSDLAGPLAEAFARLPRFSPRAAQRTFDSLTRLRTVVRLLDAWSELRSETDAQDAAPKTRHRLDALLHAIATELHAVFAEDLSSEDATTGNVAPVMRAAWKTTLAIEKKRWELQLIHPDGALTEEDAQQKLGQLTSDLGVAYTAERILP